MAKRKYILTLENVSARLKAGFGSGYGKYYIPFISVRDVASKGRSNRPYGHTTGRTYQLLSDVEHNHFLVFDNDESCVDIREQYPLPLESTQDIAARLNIRHPRDIGVTHDKVMTTDLLVTFQRDGYQALKACAVKRSSDLEDKRVNEKLDIEARYWLEQGTEFAVLTELNYPIHLVRSLQWLQPRRDMSIFVEPFEGYRNGLAADILRGLVEADSEMPLNEFCIALDKRFANNLGAHLMMARHMLACRALVADLAYPDLWFIPVGMISITTYAIDEWTPEVEHE